MKVAEPVAMLPAAIARAILAGFDRHYGLFRYNAQQAKARFERGDWHGIRRLASERIAFYDLRVREAAARIEHEFGANTGLDGSGPSSAQDPSLPSSAQDPLWQQVRREYVALLAEHRQPELAETFFNSVCAKLLHRSSFPN